MPDRPFPFRRRAPKLHAMSNPEQRRLTAPIIVLLACLVATAALTLLFAIAPELANEAGSSLPWLAS
jgi:hypothetical protein